MELIKAEWQEDKKHVIATYKMLGTDFRNQLIKDQREAEIKILNDSPTEGNKD